MKEAGKFFLFTMNPGAPHPHRKPIILIPATNAELDGHRVTFATKRYAEAVRFAGGLPLVIPNAEPGEIDTLLDMADGILLTGAAANVHPRHFGETVANPALPLDPERDDLTLTIIPRALALGVPLLAICRGFQEINVALGGSLHQAVQELPGHMDHRSAAHELEVVYRPAHDVAITQGGALEAIVGPGTLRVNSVHGQGVNRPAAGLRVEARAPDGLIEAFSIPEARGFSLALQWHPEWRPDEDPASTAIFKAFGDACRKRLGLRRK